MAGFWDFFTGGSKWSDRQDDIYNKLINYDNRSSDFKTLAGQSLNNLANRGVINSTVGADSLSRAAALADRNYWNNQMALANLAFSQKDGSGLLGGLLDLTGNIGNSFAGGLGGGLGKTWGQKLFK